MRLGDWIVVTSMVLNFAALAAYAYQGQWRNVAYFSGAFIINASIVGMK